MFETVLSETVFGPFPISGGKLQPVEPPPEARIDKRTVHGVPFMGWQRWRTGVKVLHPPLKHSMSRWPRPGSCGPGKLTEKGKFPKLLRGGCKRSFGPREHKASCTGASPFCTGAKAVLGGAKDFSETFAPWVQKTFAPSPKQFWEFSFFGQFLRPAASQA